MGSHSRGSIFRRLRSRASRLADLSVQARNERAGESCPACSIGRMDFPCTCPGDCGRRSWCGGGFR